MLLIIIKVQIHACYHKIISLFNSQNSNLNFNVVDFKGTKWHQYSRLNPALIEKSIPKQKISL
jgi:hypothetical protein